MSNGFRWSCIYGSYSTDEDSKLGLEIGFMNIENLNGGSADTFTIAIMIANFNFAIGIILREH